MSQEKSQWMYDKWLSGNEATNGKPWWSGAGDNPANHFEGMIPIERVMELFNFNVDMRKVWVEDANGNLFQADEYLAAVPDNQQAVYGIHSNNFSMQGHQFRQWLIEGPAKCCNGVVGVTNACLLKNGAVAFVNLSTPESWKTPQGVDFQPNLLFATGCDGVTPSIVKETAVVSLCDNTMQAALRSHGLSYSIKHTKNSAFKLTDAQSALRLIEANAETIASEIATLCDYKVTDLQFDAFMAALVPLPEIKERDINKKDYSTRSATMAANKREKLNELYRNDGRVAPWSGTAYGVLQMVNTFGQHVATQRNAEHRALRNMENVINGKVRQADVEAMELLAKICEREMVAA